MKMKKYFTLIAALCLMMGAVSCQDDLSNGIEVKKSFTITATIDSDNTKVSYDVVDNTVSPSWEENDVVFGWDDLGQEFTFTVSSVDNGVATMTVNGDYVPGAATMLYAIYYPGKDQSYIEDEEDIKSVTVDLALQTGSLNSNSPVLMCATGAIDGDGVKLVFHNSTAIIGVKKFQVAPNESITGFTIDGVATSATFEVVDGVMTLVPDTETNSINATFSEPLVADADGMVTTPVYFAAIPSASAELTLNVTTATGDYFNTSAIPQTDILAGHYYYMSKKMGVPVADVDGYKYFTISDAVNAANRTTGVASVLTLLADCFSDENLVFGSYGTSTVTIDLNGKTLTFSAGSLVVQGGRSVIITDFSSNVVAQQGTLTTTAANAPTVNVAAASTLTVNGGHVTSLTDPDLGTEACKAAIYVQSAATLNVHGGYIAGNSSAQGAVYVISSSDASAQKSSINMDGGEISGKYTVLRLYRANADLSGGAVNCTYPESSTYSCVYVSNNNDSESPSSVSLHGSFQATSSTSYAVRAYYGTVNVSGGTYSALRYPANAYAGTLNVSGGVFSNTTSYVTALQSTDEGSINISGGQWKSVSNIIGRLEEASINSTVSGGIFNRMLVSSYISEGYGCSMNDEAETFAEGYEFKVSDSPVMLAEMDGVSYTSISAAFADASSADSDKTITILHDAYLWESAEYTGSHTLTLDLNGKNIDMGSYIKLATDGASMIIEGTGTLTRRSGGQYAVYVSDGSMTVNGGTFIGGTESYGLFRGAGGVLTFNDGATVIGNNYAIYQTMTTGTVSTTSSLVINGGLFKGNSYAVYAYNTSAVSVTVNDGFFYSVNEGKDISKGTAASLSIQGGHYKSAIPCDEGYVCQEGIVVEDGLTFSYEVSAGMGDPVARIGEVEYGTIEGAIAAANASSTDVVITVLKDITLLAYQNVTNSSAKVTLDLNGKTISGDYYIRVNGEGADLTIVDNSTEKTGCIERTSSSGSAVGAYIGKVTLSGGTFKGKYANGTVNVQSGGNLVINAGVTVMSTETDPELAAKTVAVYAAAESKLTINGGTFAAGYALEGYSSSNVTVNGGTFTGVTYAAYSYTGIMTINDGRFISDDTALYSRMGARVTVNGGTFRGIKYGAYLQSASASVTRLTINGPGSVFFGETYAVYAYNGTYTYPVPELKITDGTFSSNGTYAINCTGNVKADISGGSIISETGGIYLQNNVALTLSGNAYVHAVSGYAIYSYTSVASRVNTVVVEDNAVLRSEQKRVIYSVRKDSSTGTSSISVNGGYFSSGQASGADSDEDSASTLFYSTVASWTKISGGYFDRHVRATYVTNGGGTQSTITPVNDPLSSKVGNTATLVSYDHQVSPAD